MAFLACNTCHSCQGSLLKDARTAFLKKRLLAYAAKYPELCKQTDGDGQGGLWLEIDKSRVSIRLTAPYSDSRKEKLAREAKKENLRKEYKIANE